MIVIVTHTVICMVWMSRLGAKPNPLSVKKPEAQNRMWVQEVQLFISIYTPRLCTIYFQKHWNYFLTGECAKTCFTLMKMKLSDTVVHLCEKTEFNAKVRNIIKLWSLMNPSEFFFNNIVIHFWYLTCVRRWLW